jgi:PAS domain S-box-containing protein
LNWSGLFRSTGFQITVFACCMALSFWSVVAFNGALHGEFFLVGDLYLMTVLACFWWRWTGLVAASLSSAVVVAVHLGYSPGVVAAEEWVKWAFLSFTGGVVSIISTSLRITLERLASSEQRWRTLGESLPMGIALFDRSGAVISANQGGNADGSDRSCLDLTRVASARYLEDRATRIEESGTGFTESREENAPDGSAIFVEDRYLPAVRGNGEDRFIALSVDVTETVMTERRIQALVAATSRMGVEFLPGVLVEIAAILELRCAFVAQHAPDQTGAMRTIALTVDGMPAAERVFDFACLPYSTSEEMELCLIRQGVRRQVADSSPFADVASEGFISAPLRSGNGALLGVMAGFSDRPIANAKKAGGLFILFARIIAIELEQHHTMNELKRSDENFRHLARNIDEAYWIWDIGKERMAFVSFAFAGIWGRSVDGFMRDHRTMLDAVRPADREQVKPLFAASADVTGVNLRTKILRPDGRVRWVWLRSYPVSDNSGRVTRIIGCASDITEQQEMTDRIARSEERFRSIIGNIQSGFLLVDDEGAVTMSNKAAAHQIGCEEGAVLEGRRLDDVLPGAMELLRRTEPGEQQVVSLSLPDGEMRTIGFTASRESSGGWIMILRDLTRQIEAEDRRRRAEELSVFGAVAARLSHDIKNSLMTILTGLHMVRIDTKNGSVHEVLDDITHEIEIMSGTAASILDTARIRPLSPRPTTLAGLVADLSRTLQPMAAANQVTLRVEKREEITLVVDEPEFRKAIGNLLINAIEAGGRESSVEISFDFLDGGKISRLFPGFTGRVAEITIRDDGPGIPADAVARIFKPFYTTKPKGTGLGLPIALEVVEAHGGTLELSMMRGRGTTATILMPVVDVRPCHEAVGGDQCGDCRVKSLGSGFCCWAVVGKETRITSGSWLKRCQRCDYFLARNLSPFRRHDPSLYEGGPTCRV